MTGLELIDVEEDQRKRTVFENPVRNLAESAARFQGERRRGRVSASS
jgi:hypothetical protein